MKNYKEILYKEIVTNWVLDKLSTGVTSFNDLIRNLPGVYPSSVYQTLLALVQKNKISQRVCDQLFKPILSKQTKQCSYITQPKFPTPHPLDFEWRYTTSCAKRIIAKCLNLKRSSGPLILLGVPSITPIAINHKKFKQIFVLDNNQAMINNLRESCPQTKISLCDIIQDQLPVPSKSAAFVVIDPPWYPCALHSFLWAGVKMCQLRGYILLSLPPLGTRPGMFEERRELLSLAEKLGLRLVSLEESVLPYKSPLFEWNALRADGLINVVSDWRRGDLAIFVRTTTQLSSRPIVPSHKETWFEVAVAGIRIRFRSQTKVKFSDPSLYPIISGNILPTVSQRDPRRQQVDVWTSGNRVFRCGNTFILSEIFKALATNQTPKRCIRKVLGYSPDSRETHLIEIAWKQATKLIEVECEDEKLFRARYP